MKRLVKHFSAVQNNANSPFSDEDCLKILEDKGYGYVLDKSKYERVGTFNREIGFYGFYCYQALTNKEKETIKFPIIFYNEIYTFKEINKTGRYETFLISWPHDTKGQMLSTKENVTPDKLVRKDPFVKRYDVYGGQVKNKFSATSGDTIDSYATIGNFETFDEAFNVAMKNI